MEYTQEQEAFIEATKPPAGYHWAYCGDELGFSWSSCDCCGCSLGGDSYAAALIADTNSGNTDIIDSQVCVDCICYIANGDIPQEWSAE